MCDSEWLVRAYSDGAHRCLRRPAERIERSQPPYKGGALAVELCRHEFGSGLGPKPAPRVEPGRHPYHGCALPVELHRRRARCESRTRRSTVTGSKVTSYPNPATQFPAASGEWSDAESNRELPGLQPGAVPFGYRSAVLPVPSRAKRVRARKLMLPVGIEPTTTDSKGRHPSPTGTPEATGSERVERSTARLKAECPTQRAWSPETAQAADRIRTNVDLLCGQVR